MVDVVGDEKQAKMEELSEERKDPEMSRINLDRVLSRHLGKFAFGMLSSNTFLLLTIFGSLTAIGRDHAPVLCFFHTLRLLLIFQMRQSYQSV